MILLGAPADSLAGAEPGAGRPGSWTSIRPNAAGTAVSCWRWRWESEATPPSPAQLEERLRDTELGERLRPLLVQAGIDGDLADALPQEVSDASRRLADNIRHAQLEWLTEKERHQGLTDEEKRRLLECRMSAGPKSVLICVKIF